MDLPGSPGEERLQLHNKGPSLPKRGFENHTSTQVGMAKRSFKLCFCLATGLCLGLNSLLIPVSAQPADRTFTPVREGVRIQATNETTVVTNGPAVFRFESALPSPSLVGIEHPKTKVFDHFLPDSVNNASWTNLISITNGRNMAIWSTRSHPPEWPRKPPVVSWNTNSLIWGLKGMTALSPCWEDEGSSGQVPVTALTRRHGYTRGHGMGPDGFTTLRNGKKVWFLTMQNKLVEATVERAVIRMGASGDYALLLFGADLPASIQPLGVVDYGIFTNKYPRCEGAPWPILKTEQTGNVIADLPGFTGDTWKSGDSGSPNMLLLNGELLFLSGRSTSTPSRQMQADMDELCRKERLDPKKYQLRWMELSNYRSYGQAK